MSESERTPSQDDSPTQAALDPEVAAALPLFAPGATLAGRYRVVRFIARGGMGEVYEARDVELDAPVALKTIRPALLRADPTALERFRREVLLARRVTHPHVARVFDLAHQDTPGGDIAFITMELLEGETLAQLLRRRGRLRTAEALPFAAQIAEGLDAAHRAGVVHRDLKPSNVMLCAASPDGRPRATITDFGVAVGTAAGEPARGVAGTPEYMAPEQVEGREASPASDVYAFGLLLYEMVTGARPFPAATPAASALERLQRAPLPPREQAPGLDARWEAAILRCLERDPARRFATAGEAVAALGPHLPGGRKRRRWTVPAAALALLAAAGALWTRGGGAPRGTEQAVLGEAPVLPRPPSRLRRSVAVLGFRNSGARPDAQWLSTAFAEMLTTELASSEALRAVPGETVARMKLDLGLQDADRLAGEELARIRGHLGSDVVVLGSYDAWREAGAERIRLRVTAQDAAGGGSLVSFSDSAAASDLLDLVTRAGGRLRRALGDEGPLAAPRRSLATHPALARLYSEGLAHLRVFEAQRARQKLEQAAAVAPSEPLVHAMLAAAWADLGHDHRARAAAQRSFELAAGLPEEERLWVEGRYREAAKDWARAIEVYLTLWTRAPDQPEYGLRLAQAMAVGGRGGEAFRVVEALRRFPSPVGDDPRLDLAEATASLWTSDFKRQQRAAARAAERGAAMGARQVVARARLLELWALARLGDSARLPEVARQALEAYGSVGDLGGAAQVHNGLGNWHWQEGRLAEARSAYERSFEVAARIGNVTGQASARNNIGVLLWEEGADLEAARRFLEEAHRDYVALSHRRGMAAGHNNVALVLFEQGRLDEAAARLARALAISQEAGEKRGVAEALLHLARLHQARDERPAARRRYEESLKLFRETGETRGEANALAGLGRLLAAEGDAANARLRLHEGAELARRGRHRAVAVEALTALGDLLEAEGDTAAAQEAWALAQAEAAAQRRTDPAARVAAAGVEARLAAAADPARAARGLAEALEAARSLQRRPLRLEAALLLGRLELRAGRAEAARARLRAVEEEAARAGYRALAARARLAAGGTIA